MYTFAYLVTNMRLHIYLANLASAVLCSKNAKGHVLGYTNRKAAK
jgi:hypothetical protein